MDFLVDHGATKSYGLDVAARLIGMPGRLDCNGASVRAMIDACRLEDVRAYCSQDVAQTIAIFLRTQLIRGATYERAPGVLLAAIGTEPRAVARGSTASVSSRTRPRHRRSAALCL